MRHSANEVRVLDARNLSNLIDGVKKVRLKRNGQDILSILDRKISKPEKRPIDKTGDCWTTLLNVRAANVKFSIIYKKIKFIFPLEFRSN